jgi:hypothetical protein
VQHLKLGFACLLDDSLAAPLTEVATTAEINDFTKQYKVRFVSSQTEHDQVGVLAVHTVASVWTVSRLGPLVTNVLNDFVLAFSRHIATAEDNLKFAPQRILFDLFANEPFNMLHHELHEFSPGRDTIAIKKGLFVYHLSFRTGSIDALFTVKGGAESPSTLLVELGSGSDAIDGQEEHFLRLNNFRDASIDVAKDGEHNFASS